MLDNPTNFNEYNKDISNKKVESVKHGDELFEEVTSRRLDTEHTAAELVKSATWNRDQRTFRLVESEFAEEGKTTAPTAAATVVSAVMEQPQTVAASAAEVRPAYDAAAAAQAARDNIVESKPTSTVGFTTDHARQQPEMLQAVSSDEPTDYLNFIGDGRRPLRQEDFDVVA